MELSKARSMVELIMTMVRVLNKEKRRSCNHCKELIMTMVRVLNKEKRRSCNHCKELEGVRNKTQDKGIMYRGFVSLAKVQ
jgi:predicted transcriptional regulator